ncbi:hypothetical protein HanXRQr2_Chr07g0284981 [Helianthus annuus]|uniref:Uncharacterized protein n=1 Tax=Helianthus annuus TaxID=4232 RepID=A0A9K3NEQ3_HELAN|nr:hypothetical protein HanXRQr2_Chr07g0284981 [Helianthus annuus]KAJ0903939.1 hypothetical protein HanPSC8_Chr07g0275901 [Helianthus annuus]
MTPKLAPPPPLRAQKTSSPMAFRSSIRPFASTSFTSSALSAPSPYFLIMEPYAPPVM